MLETPATPLWVTHLLWTLLTVGAAYVIGQAIRVLVMSRLARLAARTEGDADDVLVSEVKRRIPFWSVLVGLYLSLQFWDLEEEPARLAVRVLAALGVWSVTLAIATFGARVVSAYGPRAAVPVSGLTQNIVRGLVILLGVLVILGTFDVEITPMLTALGVGGLAVALALQDPLSNLFAGLSVSLAGHVQIGDYIRFDSGIEGSVLDFNWRSTRLRQLAGPIVEVPNIKLAQAIITNFTLPAADMGFGVDFVVAHGNDLAHVERVAAEAAAHVVRSVPGAVLTSAPTVRFTSFTEAGVRGSVGMRISGFTDQFLVRHEAIKQVHGRLRAAGVRLPEVHDLSPRPGA